MTAAPHHHTHARACPEVPVGPPLSAVPDTTPGSARLDVPARSGRRPGPTALPTGQPTAGAGQDGTQRREPAPTSPLIRRLPGPGAIADLLATATTEVLAMGTLSASSPAFRYLGGHAVRPEVQFRALFPDIARTRPVLCQHLVELSLAGADVRTIPEVPLDAVLVDDRAVVLPAERSASVVELTLPGAVLTTRELFERLWPEAVPLTDTEDLSTDRELTDREELTLRMLASGTTDEVIAAHMGLAVRTVRRTVSVLMNRLGARSRFQAGAKAAARGWILDPTNRAAG